MAGTGMSPGPTSRDSVRTISPRIEISALNQLLVREAASIFVTVSDPDASDDVRTQLVAYRGSEEIAITTLQGSNVAESVRWDTTAVPDGVNWRIRALLAWPATWDFGWGFPPLDRPRAIWWAISTASWRNVGAAAAR